MSGEISLQSARNRLREDPNIRLVDVRTPAEYQRGHIQGAVNVPLDSIGEIVFAAPGKNMPIFVYCKSGLRSAQAKDALEDLGYTNVTNIGSLLGWPIVQ